MANPYQKLGAAALEGGEWIEVTYESARSPVKQTRAGVVLDAFSHPRERDVHKIWFREAENPDGENLGTAPLFELVIGNDADNALRKSSAEVAAEAAFMYVPPANPDAVETRWTRLNDARNPGIDVTIEHE